jgi:hypothetical protein
MTKRFEADVCPETFAPRLRLNFDNGWAVSIVLRMEANSRCEFGMASLAACPTGRWGTGATELGENEASPDEVATYVAMIAARPQVVAS